MKATLLVIILAAIAAGWWQGQELSRLKQREAELGGASAKAGVPLETTASKSSRRDAKAALDGAGFVALLAKSVEKGKRPSKGERVFLRDQIAAASGRELKQWVVALRDSPLPEELKKEVLVSIAPRLAEHDPKLAAELVIAGDEGMPFRSVLRTWLAKDAVAAAAWLEEIEPPQFRNPEYLDFPGLCLAAKIAADPAKVDELLVSDQKKMLGALWELSAIQTPADLSGVLQRISRESSLPESERLLVIRGVLSGYRDPAMARQMLVDVALPREQFVQVAAAMIRSLDPAGKAASVEWVKSLPDARQREELLKEVMRKDG
ncbi:hypothetical protein OKA05_28955 [Luteolibacter arcticus]|uniref:HEAT repeat domain-containing protein n=1 Tax=Luteolibacter arcticus TaxID=1581411 RepID=A0ABT3GSZ9_9BACT|nr:hypothetical protein [Luteolibacter arcticus]MCW1926617.1 hypothetical protein [Luteolibacter arcticus]